MRNYQSPVRGRCGFTDPILLQNGPSRLFFRLKMAEYANLVRRALGQLGGHGGVRGFLLQLFRSVEDIRI